MVDDIEERLETLEKIQERSEKIRERKIQDFWCWTYFILGVFIGIVVSLTFYNCVS